MSILSTTRKARAATLASESHAAHSLHRLHYHAVVQVKDGVARFIQAMQTATDANFGEVPAALGKPTPSWAIIKAINVSMQQFGNSARTIISAEQHAAATRGTIMAQQQLQATVPRGYTWHFTAPAPSMEAQEKRVHTLFDKYGDEAAKAATDAIRTGVLAGHNPAVIARDIQDALGESLANALTISRTEAMRSLRDATTENYRANDDVVDNWIWLASGDACAMCLAMSGSEHSIDEDMESHVNCRCTQVPKTKSWADIFAGTGIDVSDIPETTAVVPLGTDIFAAKTEAEQRDILGNAKYNAWKAGDITLQDLVGTGHNAVWGASRYERSLKELGLNAGDYSDE